MAAWLPPVSAAHPDVMRMRGWLDAAAGTGCRIVYRPEAVSHEPLRYRLAGSFAHVCRVLGVMAALEVSGGPLPEPLRAVLAARPELSVAIAVALPDQLARAVGAWGPRLAVALIPQALAPGAAACTGMSGWIVTNPLCGADTPHTSIAHACAPARAASEPRPGCTGHDESHDLPASGRGDGGRPPAAGKSAPFKRNGL